MKACEQCGKPLKRPSAIGGGCYTCECGASYEAKDVPKLKTITNLNNHLKGLATLICINCKKTEKVHNSKKRWRDAKKLMVRCSCEGLLLTKEVFEDMQKTKRITLPLEEDEQRPLAEAISMHILSNDDFVEEWKDDGEEAKVEGWIKDRTALVGILAKMGRKESGKNFGSLSGRKQ